MKPSAEAVLNLLEQRGSYGATDRDCLLYAHQSRAAARVWELRQAGYRITTSYESKYGATFARYRLVGGQEDARPAVPPVAVAHPSDGRRAVTVGSRSD